MTTALQAVEADQVFVDGLVRSIPVGILPEEQGVRQNVRFAVTLTLGAEVRASEDRPGVSYVDIVDAIDALTVEHTPLLEHLGEAIAARVLANPRVVAASVTIEKLDRLGGQGTFGVRLVRERAA